MNPIRATSQEDIYQATLNGVDFIIDPALEELHFICYHQVGLVMWLDTAKLVANKLRNHQALTKIVLDEHPLCNEAARWICEALSTINTLKEVSFINTFTTPDAMKWIVELINARPQLKSLIIQDSLIFAYYNSAQFKKLFEALEASQLKELKIRSDQLGENQVITESLANFLKRNNSLKSFDVGVQSTGHQMDDSRWAKIFDGIADSSSITKFKLSGYVSGELSIRGLVNCLRTNKKITDLDLAGCNLSDPQIVPIIEAIMENDSIEYLDLSSNNIATEGHQALAKYLARTNWLVHLDVSYGENRGLRYLWEGLTKNTTLLHLEMLSVSKETFHWSDAERSVKAHPTLFKFGCDEFNMGKYNPLTQILEENKKKIRRRRKDITFIVLTLAKSALTILPPEIWLLILRNVTVPSYNRLGRADLLFNCIMLNYDEIFERIERRQKFKLIQHDKAFLFTDS